MEPQTDGTLATPTVHGGEGAHTWGADLRQKEMSSNSFRVSAVVCRIAFVVFCACGRRESVCGTVLSQDKLVSQNRIYISARLHIGMPLRVYTHCGVMLGIFLGCRAIWSAKHVPPGGLVRKIYSRTFISRANGANCSVQSKHIALRQRWPHPNTYPIPSKHPRSLLQNKHSSGYRALHREMGTRLSTTSRPTFLATQPLPYCCRELPALEMLDLISNGRPSE